jgi:hypothetical protein
MSPLEALRAALVAAESKARDAHLAHGRVLVEAVLTCDPSRATASRVACDSADSDARRLRAAWEARQ